MYAFIDFVGSNLLQYSQVLYSSNIYELLLYNRQLFVITYEIIYLDQAAHHKKYQPRLDKGKCNPVMSLIQWDKKIRGTVDVVSGMPIEFTHFKLCRGNDAANITYQAPK